MSYSFSVRASTKAEAKQKVADKLAEVVTAQPTHKADIVQAQAAADAFIALLDDDESRDVTVAVNGWLSWSGTTEPQVFSGACVGVTASLSAKESV